MPYITEVVKIVFTEFGHPKIIMSDTGTDFKSDMFRQFYRELSIKQAITSSFHH